MRRVQEEEGGEPKRYILYSLRPELLVVEMYVSRAKKCQGTSILATSNLGQREYYEIYYLYTRKMASTKRYIHK